MYRYGIANCPAASICKLLVSAHNGRSAAKQSLFNHALRHANPKAARQTHQQMSRASHEFLFVTGDNRHKGLPNECQEGGVVHGGRNAHDEHINTSLHANELSQGTYAPQIAR